MWNEKNSSKVKENAQTRAVPCLTILSDCHRKGNTVCIEKQMTYKISVIIVFVKEHMNLPKNNGQSYGIRLGNVVLSS